MAPPGQKDRLTPGKFIPQKEKGRCTAVQRPFLVRPERSGPLAFGAGEPGQTGKDHEPAPEVVWCAQIPALIVMDGKKCRSVQNDRWNRRGRRGADGGQAVTNPAALLPETFHAPVWTATGDEELPGATLFQFTPPRGGDPRRCRRPGRRRNFNSRPTWGQRKICTKEWLFLVQNSWGTRRYNTKNAGFQSLRLGGIHKHREHRVPDPYAIAFTQFDDLSQPLPRHARRNQSSPAGREPQLTCA